MLYQAGPIEMELSQKDRKFLDASIDAQLAFWSLRDEVPGTLPVLFMLIARTQGITSSELTAKSGYNQANVSKLLKILIQELELVHAEMDAKDYRVRRFSLTASGEKFLTTILPK